MYVHKVAFPLIYGFVWKTKAGIAWMDRFSEKFKKSLKILGYISIFLGFAGLIFASYGFIKSALDFFLTPEVAVAGAGIVLPIKAKGVFFVSFFYWIISLSILVVVHEFSHGVFARWAKIKIKSTGFFLGAILVPILPGAFVQPDQKEYLNASTRDRLMIASAGPFGNFITGLFFWLILFFIFFPIVGSMTEPVGGVNVFGIEDGTPAFESGMRDGLVITSIDGLSVQTTEDFQAALVDKGPGDTVEIEANESTYIATLGPRADDASKAYLGVFIVDQQRKAFYNSGFGLGLWNTLDWIAGPQGLLFWLILLNIGIGLFNLLPIGPLDGGQMLWALLDRYFDKKVSLKILSVISIVFFVILIINIIPPFIR